MTASVQDLADLLIASIRSDCPPNELLTRRRFLQVMESHPHFSRCTVMRRYEHIRARATQRAGKVDLNFGVVTFLEGWDAEQWRIVSSSSSNLGSRRRLHCNRSSGGSRHGCHCLSRWTRVHRNDGHPRRHRATEEDLRVRIVSSQRSFRRRDQHKLRQRSGSRKFSYAVGECNWAERRHGAVIIDRIQRHRTNVCWYVRQIQFDPCPVIITKNGGNALRALYCYRRQVKRDFLFRWVFNHSVRAIRILNDCLGSSSSCLCESKCGQCKSQNRSGQNTRYVLAHQLYLPCV